MAKKRASDSRLSPQGGNAGSSDPAAPVEKKAEQLKKAVDALSDELKSAVVEDVLGLHPDYFVYAGLEITPNMYKLARDGVRFSKWKGNTIA